MATGGSVPLTISPRRHRQAGAIGRSPRASTGSRAGPAAISAWRPRIPHSPAALPGGAPSCRPWAGVACCCSIPTQAMPASAAPRPSACRGSPSISTSTSGPTASPSMPSCANWRPGSPDGLCRRDCQGLPSVDHRAARRMEPRPAEKDWHWRLRAPSPVSKWPAADGQSGERPHDPLREAAALAPASVSCSWTTSAACWSASASTCPRTPGRCLRAASTSMRSRWRPPGAHARGDRHRQGGARGQGPGLAHYDLPPDLADRIWKGRFRGQRQKWFAFRFQGRDQDIDIATQHPSQPLEMGRDGRTAGSHRPLQAQALQRSGRGIRASGEEGLSAGGTF